MLYDLKLKITYTYTEPATGGRHLLRLLPMDIPQRQRLIAGHVETAPLPAERREYLDFFGNGTVEVTFRDPHEEIAFEVLARVSRLAVEPEFDVSTELSLITQELQSLRSIQPDSPAHFTAASPLVPLDTEIADYTRDAIQGSGTVLSAVRAVGRALHRDMKFDAEATTVETPLREAFTNRHGVCQDFTHIMISGLRGVGIPAGYVSGVLRTEPPPGKPRLEGADAMHAWVRAWCGVDAGWIDYDPTNAIEVGTDHVEIAHGRDYSDVAPVKGVLRASGTQTSNQAVDLIPLSE
ncbi:MAG: transglutaminase family protein [Magnetospiraceae bacterium]